MNYLILLYLGMYWIGIFSDDPRYIFFFSTIFVSFSFFFVYTKVVKHTEKLSNVLFLVCFLLVLFSFNYGYLFSGLRFYVGAAFTLLAWYYVFYEKKVKLGALLLFLAVASHFATLLLVLGISALLLFKRFSYKYVFYFSFVFAILPGSFLYDIISSLPVGTSITSKAYDYLMYNDILLSAAEGAETLQIILLIKRSWVFIVLFIVLINRKRKEEDAFLLQSMFLFVAIRNLFTGAPTISQYYDTFSIFITLLYFLNKVPNKQLGKGYLFFIFVVLNFLIDVYKYRDSFIQSNLKAENLTSATIFGSEVAKPIKTTWK